MVILTKIPTRGRPGIFKKTLEASYNQLSNKHQYDFVISINEDDKTMNNKKMLAFMKSFKGLHINCGNFQTKTEAFNADLSHREFDVIIMGSDDLVPIRKNYDDILAALMNAFFPNLDGCLFTDDGIQGYKMATQPFMGFNLYRKIGYLTHPKYKSLYGDRDRTKMFRQLKCLQHVDVKLFIHDWAGNNNPLIKKNNINRNHDKMVYKRRLAAGFPFDCPSFPAIARCLQ